MPLYMDLHEIDSETFTEEVAYKAHLKDLAVQGKYGVTHHKFWINFDQKTLFCLVEGPNKEACNAAHIESHGGTSCNIIEVSTQEGFIPFMGIGSKNNNDLALTLSGELDNGYRTLMLISIADFSGKSENCIDEIYRLIKQHHGNKIIEPNGQIMVSFIYASDAVLCVMAISNFLKTIPDSLEYSLALVTGKPVDKIGSDLFGEAKNRLQLLCRVGQSKVIYIDSGTKTIIGKDFEIPNKEKVVVKYVYAHDFLFYKALWETLDSQIPDPNFKSEHLCKKLGLSRAQTYRKIKALTGMSPNELIREMRLRKSLKALKSNHKTVAEIAYDLGFNSPTYFTRVFRNRYEVLPTSYARLSVSN